MDNIMDDCKMYNKTLRICNGLKELVCKKGECSFYKPKSENEEEEE